MQLVWYRVTYSKLVVQLQKNDKVQVKWGGVC